ncbi:MAG: hypothetical protein JWN58_2690, partial [Gammaproteobacteria bacterium]|nr:hypothetical protein [Gammaproteobacteria bacterium]
PDDQVQRLYLLVDAAVRVHKQNASLAHLPFVRLENGTRAAPSKALLSPSDAPVDEEAASYGLPLVRTALTRSGRARGKEVDQFLRKTGVKEIGEADYVTAIIRANYADAARAPTAERHLQHMRRFLRWYADDRDCTPFSDVAFLRAEGIDGLCQARAIYLDLPFAQNGLSRVYGGRVKGRDRRPLWSGYSKLKRPELLAFVKAAGVEDALVVERTRIPYAHPRRGNLFNGFGSTRTTSTEINSDFNIAELPSLLALGDRQISRMIWNAIVAAGSKSMYARHAPNQAYEPRQELSTLAFALRDAAWMPAKNGSLHRPSTITASELADGFLISGNEGWLGAIEFGADHRRRSEQHQARRNAAQTMGLPAELADHLERMSPEARETLGSEMLRRIAGGAFNEPEFPEREAPNPERRADRQTQRAQAVSVKTYEVRNRSVRTSDREARQLARPYLRDFYSNSAGDMICQACHQVMPFRLADGAHYFEAPELIQSASAELAENHLALCPTCSAKWQHANSTSDSEICDAIREANTPDISVTLAGEVVRLRFVQIHLEDLRTVFSVVAGMTRGQGPAS